MGDVAICSCCASMGDMSEMSSKESECQSDYRNRIAASTMAPRRVVEEMWDEGDDVQDYTMDVELAESDERDGEQDKFEG